MRRRPLLPLAVLMTFGVGCSEGSDTTERTITCRQQGPDLRCR